MLLDENRGPYRNETFHCSVSNVNPILFGVKIAWTRPRDQRCTGRGTTQPSSPTLKTFRKCRSNSNEVELMKQLTETAVCHHKWAAYTKLREYEGQLGFGGTRSGRHWDWEPPCWDLKLSIDYPLIKECRKLRITKCLTNLNSFWWGRWGIRSTTKSEDFWINRGNFEWHNYLVMMRCIA